MNASRNEFDPRSMHWFFELPSAPGFGYFFPCTLSGAIVDRRQRKAYDARMKQVAAGSLKAPVLRDTTSLGHEPTDVPPNVVGAVDFETGRHCVLVATYAASPLNGEAAAYWYSADAGRMGLDPWALVEGIDPHRSGIHFDVWFASGSCITVDATATLYVSARHASIIEATQDLPHRVSDQDAQQRAILLDRGCLGDVVRVLHDVAIRRCLRACAVVAWGPSPLVGGHEL